MGQQAIKNPHLHTSWWVSSLSFGVLIFCWRQVAARQGLNWLCFFWVNPSWKLSRIHFIFTCDQLPTRHPHILWWPRKPHGQAMFFGKSELQTYSHWLQQKWSGDAGRNYGRWKDSQALFYIMTREHVYILGAAALKGGTSPTDYALQLKNRISLFQLLK